MCCDDGIVREARGSGSEEAWRGDNLSGDTWTIEGIWERGR